MPAGGRGPQPETGEAAERPDRNVALLQRAFLPVQANASLVARLRPAEQAVAVARPQNCPSRSMMLA